MLNNFIYTENKLLFTKELKEGNVPDEAIAFIEDTKEIWTHGTYFNCNDINIVDSLEDSSIDKALSANMGKYLNELISNINVNGSSLDSIKFKGYVNVDNKTGVNAIFDTLQVNEACFVIPSTNDGTGDSYIPWVTSSLSDNTITLGEDLLEIEGFDVSSLIAGNGFKTYFALDSNYPYCTCPDLLLLAKVKIKVKQFLKLLEVSDLILATVPDNLEVPVCIGKIVRWSAGDWLLNHKEEFSLTHKYGYNQDMDEALETGVIGYTATCASGMPGDIQENFTVVITGTSDADPNYRTIQQTAYGRTGKARDRIWTRILFENVVGGNNNFLPWVETSNNNDILPNYNGWLLSSNSCLKTGVYLTCASLDSNMTVDGVYIFSNNYFTLIVNTSTTPNADGWDVIEQTAYGREIDEGLIYKRIIFYNKNYEEIQYKNWVKISGSGNSSTMSIHGFLYDDEENVGFDAVELVGGAGAVIRMLSDDGEELTAYPSLYNPREDSLIVFGMDKTYTFYNVSTDETEADVIPTYSARYATKPSRNLLANSNFENGDRLEGNTPWMRVDFGGSGTKDDVISGDFNGYNAARLKYIAYGQDLNLVEGRRYVVSCYYKADSETSVINYGYMLGGTDYKVIENLNGGSQGFVFSVSDKYQRAAFSFVAGSTSRLAIANYNDSGEGLYIACIQVEEGEVPTRYMRAEEPSDIPTKVSELSNDSGYITSTNVTNIVSITQADYDALETKSETTLYLITE